VVCADNTVVISMRACDREKSEALVHAALKESLARVGLWYMGSHTLTVVSSPRMRVLRKRLRDE